MTPDDATLLLAPERDPRLRRIDALGHLLDDSIPLPGTGRRFGLDALIGLVPGVGDAVGALLSAYIIAEAARLGAPAPLLLRMAGNVGLEALVGTVPVLGDLFDAGWKANLRNLRLLRHHLHAPGRAARTSRLWVAGVLLLLLVLLAGAGALALWLAGALLHALGLR